jgi:hypothetical protein
VKQLQHDLQLTRIDLAQREYQLNNLRIEHNSKCESLEEKCQDLTHQNQMLNARLNSLIAVCSFYFPEKVYLFYFLNVFKI